MNLGPVQEFSWREAGTGVRRLYKQYCLYVSYTNAALPCRASVHGGIDRSACREVRVRPHHFRCLPQPSEAKPPSGPRAGEDAGAPLQAARRTCEAAEGVGG